MKHLCTIALLITLSTPAAAQQKNGLLDHFVPEHVKLIEGQAVTIPPHYHRIAAFCDQCRGRRVVRPTPQPSSPPIASPYQPRVPARPQPARPQEHTSPPAVRAAPATVPQSTCPCGDLRGELAATNKSVNQLRGDVTQVQTSLDELVLAVAALEQQPAVCPLPQVVRPTEEDVAEIAGQVAADGGLLAKLKEHAGTLVAGKVAEATGVEGFLLRNGWAIGGPLGIGLTAIGAGLAIRRRRRSAATTGASEAPAAGFLGGIRRGVRRGLGSGRGGDPPADE